MADFLTDLIERTDISIFDTKRCLGDKKVIKCMIEDNLKITQKNDNTKGKSSRTIDKMIQSGDTLANYRYELVELGKLNYKKILPTINAKPMTFTTDMEECKEYVDFFRSKFKIISFDGDFHQFFFIFLFKEYASTKSRVSMSKLVDDFYDEYEKQYGSFPNKIDFTQIAKLLHFIRKGKTPLYDSTYKDFFILSDIDKIIPKNIKAENEEEKQSIIRDMKKEYFKKQYEFIRAIFNEIANYGTKKSKTNEKIYDRRNYFNEFIKRFYVNDKGITKHKMIDSSIMHFR